MSSVRRFHWPWSRSKKASKTSPVLYSFELSVWSAVAELAILELGLADKVEKKYVDLVHGENFKPEFVKINENASLPTLVGPDGTAYKNTTDVVNYLASIAPVKVKAATEITALTHEANIDPNFALLSARNAEELAAKSSAFPKVFVENRHAGLTKYSALPEAKPFEAIYTGKLAGSTWLLSLYTNTADESTKAEFYKAAQATWDALTVFYFETLPAKLRDAGAGPFLGGEKPGVDDFHVAARVAHLASLFGATKSEEGLEAFKKGFGGKDVPVEIVKYWEAWTPRESWKQVYAKTLH